jgi:hypothetical protein
MNWENAFRELELTGADCTRPKAAYANLVELQTKLEAEKKKLPQLDPAAPDYVKRLQTITATIHELEDSIKIADQGVKNIFTEAVAGGYEAYAAKKGAIKAQLDEIDTEVLKHLVAANGFWGERHEKTQVYREIIDARQSVMGIANYEDGYGKEPPPQIYFHVNYPTGSASAFKMFIDRFLYKLMSGQPGPNLKEWHYSGK